MSGIPDPTYRTVQPPPISTFGPATSSVSSAAQLLQSGISATATLAKVSSTMAEPSPTRFSNPDRDIQSNQLPPSPLAIFMTIAGAILSIVVVIAVLHCVYSCFGTSKQDENSLMIGRLHLDPEMAPEVRPRNIFWLYPPSAPPPPYTPSPPHYETVLLSARAS